ncbi:MAG: ATP-binding protein [Actinomycetota bacterium]
MTFRARVALIAAVAVGLAIAAASVGVYLVAAGTLRDSVDRSLVAIATRELPSHIGPEFRGGTRVGRFGGAGGMVQVVTAGGRIVAPPQEDGEVEPLPVSERTIDVAAGRGESFFETVWVDDVPVRILTVPARSSFAVQLARPLTEVEEVLSHLRGELALVGVAGVVFAALLGMVVARRAVRPVSELTTLAEEVAQTQDLTRRLGADARDDEIGRLAHAFDEMLAQLEQARAAQAQLVADASHELRTPLTSLRTNIEVLTRAEQLEEDDRRHLVEDVIAQIDEFSRLVGGLVELARGDQPVQRRVEVRLDELAQRIAGRVDPRQERVRVTAEPTEVTGDPDRLERAVANLIDNALKHAPAGPVEVEVTPTRVRVRDHGPGIPEDDLPHVFDRFYRATDARAAPGSGLGLAIVAQVAEAHAGRVEAANADDGGAMFTLYLPDG